MTNRSHIISLHVHNLSFQNSLDQITSWGLNNNKGFICFANSHMTVLAHKSPEFKRALTDALLILPDGKPLAIACNLLYKKKQERIAGMDFMPALLTEIGKHKATVFLYGSTNGVLDQLSAKIKTLYPAVTVVGKISPSFSNESDLETAEHIKVINASKAQFVLVALGCPKQEIWMAKNFRSLNAVLLGVGGAFPVLAGIQKRSPKVMQSLSLEWLFRLRQEPRRLFKRYLYTNISFIYLLSMALAKKHLVFRKYSNHRRSLSAYNQGRNKLNF